MRCPVPCRSAVLLLFALWPLTGCVYIPAPDSPAEKGGPNPNRLIGGPASDKPVRPGAVTRDQVVELLGAPHRRSPDDQSWAYLFRMKAGHWIVIPIEAMHADRLIAARLDFGPDGVLRDVEVDRAAPTPMNFLGPQAPRPRLWTELNWPTPRAATKPAVGPATATTSPSG